MVTRRGFIGTCSLAAAGFGIGGCKSPFGGASSDSLAVKGIRIGVQMWSIDKIWKNNPAAAFRRLKDMGYDGVQSIGFLKLDHDELEKMLSDTGLQIVDMAFRTSMLAPNNFGKYLEFCQRFKIGFVYDPMQKFSTGIEWRRHADWLAEISQKFKPYGIRVGYHNHQHELRQYFDGKTPMEYICDAGLDMELDVGHIKLAKSDPVRWLEMLKGRVPSIHAKPGGGNSVGCADDANDWPAIFSVAAMAGTKWAVVECETRRDTYEDVAASISYLRNLNKA